MALTHKQKNERSSQIDEYYDKYKYDHKFEFLNVKHDKEGAYTGVTYKITPLLSHLYTMGYRRYDTSVKEREYIYYHDNIIQLYNQNKIIDDYITLIKSQGDTISCTEKKVPTEDVLEETYRKLSFLFGDKMLDRLTPETPIQIQKHETKKAYFYYQNCYVEVTKDGITQQQYKDLQGAVWQDNILDRQYTDIAYTTKDIANKDGNTPFARFMYLIAKSDIYNLQSLMTLIGYLMHANTDGKMKAVVFTDSKISQSASGRTGKTLLGKAISKMLNANTDGEVQIYSELNGKTFDSTNKHKYQTCRTITSCLHINDLPKVFDVECLFNDITEGIEIERKGKDPLKIQPKIMISTNQTLMIEGDSAKDRFIEYELSEYFSANHSPQDEFGHWFFTDWNTAQWQSFDTFMIECVRLYLERGIIEPKNQNITMRKFIDHTCPEFWDWIKYSFISGSLIVNEYYSLNDLYDKFRASNINSFDKLSNRRFSKWIELSMKMLPQYFKPFSETLHKRRVSHGYEYLWQNSENFTYFN